MPGELNMKCDEVQTLHGPYLDSELDAKTSLEIGQHLKGCPNCARLFVEEQKLEAHVMAGLKRGPRTAALWEQLEREVVAAASCYLPATTPAARLAAGGMARLRAVLGAQLRPAGKLHAGPGPGWPGCGW